MFRIALLLPLLSCMVILLGCSQTKPVSIVSTKWSIGEHQDCIYKAKNLYCIPPSLKSVDMFPLEGAMDKNGNPIPRATLLLNVSVDFIHIADDARTKGDKDAETGVYETKFSKAPVDYSVWDCFKTGSGEPAISCALSLKPDDKLLHDIAGMEAETKMSDNLRALTEKQLIAKCGTANNITSDSISRSLHYASASGYPLAFRFETFHDEREPMLDSVRSEETLAHPKDPLEVFWWNLSQGRMNRREAAAVLRDMPCLK